MEHKHLLVRAELEQSPETLEAAEAWVKKILDGEVCSGTTPEGYFVVVVSDDGMVAARFWNSDPTLLQLDVCTADIHPTDIFDLVEEFVILSKSHLFLNRTNSMQQIF